MRKAPASNSGKSVQLIPSSCENSKEEEESEEKEKKSKKKKQKQ